MDIGKKLKELYDEAKPTYNYTLDAVLIDNTGSYISDYSAVNPEGVAKVLYFKPWVVAITHLFLK